SSPIKPHSHARGSVQSIVCAGPRSKALGYCHYSTWALHIQSSSLCVMTHKLVCRLYPLYGRSHWLRRKMSSAGLVYCADIPVDTQVYLEKPVVGVPANKKGRRATKPRVLSAEKPIEVRQIAALPETVWTRIEVRATERGYLNDEFSA